MSALYRGTKNNELAGRLAIGEAAVGIRTSSKRDFDFCESGAEYAAASASAFVARKVGEWTRV
jgi:hypothetical protein